MVVAKYKYNNGCAYFVRKKTQKIKEGCTGKSKLSLSSCQFYLITFPQLK